MKFLKFLRLLGTSALAVAFLLRLTIGDASGILRAVYYGTPWPLLAAGWTVMTWAWWKRPAVGLSCLVLAVSCGAEWMAVSDRPPPTRADGSSTALKLLSWNMAHQDLPSKDLQTLLEEWRPDIAGLIEVGARHSDPDPLVTTLPPGYTAQKLDNALAVVVRGSARVLQQDSIIDHGISKYACVEAVVDGVLWRIFIVDGASSPFSPREKILARVFSEAKGQPRTAVLGDFNTPVESVFFDPWRAELHHAFDEAGAGFRETWPSILPVLTIDHVWSSHDSPPLGAQKRWLSSSDHAALLVELGR